MDWRSDSTHRAAPIKHVENDNEIPRVPLYGLIGLAIIILITIASCNFSATVQPAVQSYPAHVTTCLAPSDSLVSMSGQYDPSKPLPVNFSQPVQPECMEGYWEFLSQQLAKSKMSILCLYHYGVMHNMCVAKNQAYPFFANATIKPVEKTTMSVMKETTSLFPDKEKKNMRRPDRVVLTFTSRTGEQQTVVVNNTIDAHILGQLHDLVAYQKTIYA